MCLKVWQRILAPPAFEAPAHLSLVDDTFYNCLRLISIKNFDTLKLRLISIKFFDTLKLSKIDLNQKCSAHPVKLWMFRALLQSTLHNVHTITMVMTLETTLMMMAKL